MRINKFVALATGMSRRSADKLITDGQVMINHKPASPGSQVNPKDEVSLSGRELKHPDRLTTIMINKPVGYVCSRNGQGSKTIYDLLPNAHHQLKPIGRLDKDSSGLLLLTNDGELADKLMHPRHQKEKVYRAVLNKSVDSGDKKRFLTGVRLADGVSKFIKLKQCSSNTYEIVLKEGRNRQIRRTFNALGYKVMSLRRLRLGDFTLKDNLKEGDYSYLEGSA